MHCDDLVFLLSNDFVNDLMKRRKMDTRALLWFDEMAKKKMTASPEAPVHPMWQVHVIFR